MQWHSVGEFFAMGGYGPYVWGSVGACALAMVLEPWLVRQQHRRTVSALQRRLRAEQSLAERAGQVNGIRRQAA